MKTYVVGHINPDTDSIVSAVALAELEGYIPARAGEINNETKYALDSFGFAVPELLPKGDKRIVLVDNNGNPEELSEAIDTTEIIAVYDHHKMGGLKTSEPITLWVETVGSTATMIADLYDLRHRPVPKKVAALLITGIISDTLNLTSPTTTNRDHEALKRLNKIASLEIEKLAQELFAAKSDISAVSTEELLTKDCKTFEMNGRKVMIGVWETVLPDSVLARKADLIKAMELEKEKSKLDLIYFIAVDILSQQAHFIIAGSEEQKVAEAVFGGRSDENVLTVPGVVSRKKQITPPLEAYFAKA